MTCFLHKHRTAFFSCAGDPEAEEVLTNIVDFVSQDENPNDEEQVKEILGEFKPDPPH